MTLTLVPNADVLTQGFAFRPSWWRRHVDPPWWPEPVDRLPEAPERSGYQRISRQDVFDLAADSSSEGRGRLLVATYMWGTGSSAFLVGRRVRVFTRTPLDVVGERLVAAADLMHSDGPVAAYESLLARQHNHIKFLGPAFFTKYLYFAAGQPTTVQPQPLILDKFVARSLNAHIDGWAIRDNGWPGSTYSRYLTLAAEHATEAGRDTSPAGFEMALFRAGR